MDPKNPRWEASELRRKRSATFWKILVGAVSGAALSAVVVASCLDRDEARRDRERDQEEPGITETTAASPPSTPTAYAPGADPAAQPAAPPVVGPSTSDSTGGVSATATTSTAERVTAPPANPVGNTTVTSGDMRRPAPYTPGQPQFESAYGPNGVNGVAATAGAPVRSDANADGSGAANTTQNPSGAADAGTNNNTNGQQNAAPDAGPQRDSRGNVIDPNNRGGNPQAPSFSAGAGRFVTEAPPWSASSFPTNPEAGAGPFTTERNTPGY
jgi:hypothetical protein